MRCAVSRGEQLCAALLETFYSKILMNNAVHQKTVNASLPFNLTHRSMRLPDKALTVVLH